jgi:protein O-GlcNAc transferase
MQEQIMNIRKTIESVLKHYHSGNFKEAELLCWKILEKQPDNAEIFIFLGMIYAQLQNYDSAIQYLKKAIKFNPKSHEAYYCLATIYQCRKEFDETIACYRKVVALNPGFVDAYNGLGNALQEKKEFDEAITCYKEAMRINPNDPTAYINIGIAMHNNGKFDDAITYLQKAVSLNPNIEMTYNYLGFSMFCQDRLSEAIQNFEASLRINPHSFIALSRLGQTLQKQGKVIEAENLYRRALQIQPNDIILHEALLMNMLYNFRYDSQTIFFEHVLFAKQFEKPLQSVISPSSSKKSLKRKLKIGYVSPDFRSHSVSYFIEPVLSSHDKEQFEVFCYSLFSEKDEVTTRLQKHVDHWQNIIEMSDEEAAESIQTDEIDILVDLAGFTANNRMFLFARKPAPIQASWIGYPATTGFSTIDYKIVDSYTDPTGISEQFYTEKLMRLPECFLCYLPERNSPEVSSLPALVSDHITFGSFNYFTKVSPEVLDLWIQILKTIPDSRLILKSQCFSDRLTREYVKDLFEHQGIESLRIDLLGWKPSIRSHLEIYNHIDIGLDTFPYNGTTTTCEALWMGVPVITLAGDTHRSRVGMSLLSNIGLPEFISRNAEEYLEIAIRTASDFSKLNSLRNGLRERVAHSALTDINRFINNLENSYKEMWRKYCETGSGSIY